MIPFLIWLFLPFCVLLAFLFGCHFERLRQKRRKTKRLIDQEARLRFAQRIKEKLELIRKMRESVSQEKEKKNRERDEWIRKKEEFLRKNRLR